MVVRLVVRLAAGMEAMMLGLGRWIGVFTVGEVGGLVRMSLASLGARILYGVLMVCWF